jgi:hypothetical protein
LIAIDAIGAFVMGIAMAWMSGLAADLPATWLGTLTSLLSIAAVGALLYVATTMALGADEPRALWTRAWRRRSTA